MRPQLADFKSSNKAPATKLDHIMYCGSGWLTWEQLRDDSSFARRGRDLWARSGRTMGRYDPLQGIQADPNRLYVADARGRLATTVWMEQEPLDLPSDAEQCWTDWLPEFVI